MAIETTVVRDTARTTPPPRPTTGTRTYYAYLWNNNGSNGSIGCTAVGTYVVGPSTSALTKASGTGSVGP